MANGNQDDLASNYQGVWGTRVGFGRRPALVAVDFLQAYTRPGAPLRAGRGGGDGPCTATAGNRSSERYSVIHTNIRYRGEGQMDGGVWVKKHP